MKQKNVTHFAIVALLVASMITGISKSAYAGGEGGSKQVKGTVCCLNGAYTGNSNDCENGSLDCSNHNCNAGETEVVGTSCSS